jgi:flagellar biosynthesis/type III secretory pathway protein FliH
MQMMGINKSPEEMQKTMTEMVKSLLQKTLDKFPEDDKKRLMAAIQQQMSGGGM